MRYKRYLFCLLNIVVTALLLAACAKKEQCQINSKNQQQQIVKLDLVFDDSKNAIEYDQGEYIIKEETIDINSKNKISLPQIKKNSTIMNQKKINSIIKNNTIKIIKSNVDIDNGSIYSFQYNVRFSSDKLLSILFQGDFYRKGAAHPLIFDFCINIDLEKNELLELDDIVIINDRVIQLFLDGKFIEKDNISRSVYLQYIEKIDQENASIILRNAEVCLSKSGIDFIIDTNYALGGYMWLELPYEL